MRRALVVCLFASACGGSSLYPNIDGIEPRQTEVGESVIVTIRGTFAPLLHVERRTASLIGVFSVTLGATELEQVVFADGSTLRAVVPADLSPGIYALTVRDPRGVEAHLDDAFAVIDPSAPSPPPTGGPPPPPPGTDPPDLPDIVVDATLSLPDAINQANADGHPNVIGFAGPTTVALTAPLPPLTEDGTTIIGGPGVVVDGSALTGADDNCFTISSSNNRIEQLEIKGCVNNAIEINNGGVANLITRCNLHDIGDEAIDLTGAGASNVLSSNVIDTCGGRCIEIDGPSTRVIDNFLSNCPLYEGLRARDAAGGSEIIGNVITANAMGIRATDQAIDLRIYHNTIVDNLGEGLLLENAGHDIRNNILDQNGDGIDASAGGIATLSRNTYFGNLLGDCTNCPAEPDRVSADPGFVNASIGDFSLTPASPCMDTAVDLGLDRNGAGPGNYTGNGPNIGAVEN